MLSDNLPRLYYITDRKTVQNCILDDFLIDIAKSGIKMVQIREKELSSRDLYNLTLKAISILRPAGIKVLVNDRVDIAIASKADGVHITSTGMPVSVVRSILPSPRIIGVSTHHAGEVISAEQNGADFVTFGPIFFTVSKAGMGEPVGVEQLAVISSVTQIPIFALGGINLSNAGTCLTAGAYGLSGIGIFQKSTNLEETVNKFTEILKKHPR